MTMTGDQPAADQDESRHETPDGSGAAAASPVVDMLRDTIAVQVLQAVAATINFLMLSPYGWVSSRTTAGERAEIGEVVAHLMTLRTQELAELCPLCLHQQCVDGCPVAIARGIVTRAGRQ